MRLRDIKALQPGDQIVVRFRELGVKGPEELATVRSVDMGSAALRTFPVQIEQIAGRSALTSRIAARVVLRRASAADVEHLTPRIVETRAADRKEATRP